MGKSAPHPPSSEACCSRGAYPVPQHRAELLLLLRPKLKIRTMTPSRPRTFLPAVLLQNGIVVFDTPAHTTEITQLEGRSIQALHVERVILIAEAMPYSGKANAGVLLVSAISACAGPSTARQVCSLCRKAALRGFAGWETYPTELLPQFEEGASCLILLIIGTEELKELKVFRKSGLHNPRRRCSRTHLRSDRAIKATAGKPNPRVELREAKTEGYEDDFAEVLPNTACGRSLKQRRCFSR